ncbi:hypothetical protein [Aegicerativicinus sediminis]|uniref:hypothetical protein n=1 Tax=Aegicerativicinus sediminis TaxID=2893202 RepID=UPI001E538754|nr:hypothetical protein [Aegicerativicinus sediminis]
MLVERLKELIADFNTGANPGEEKWHFNYGRDHWQNLQDLPDDSAELFADRNKYLMLLWQDREHKLNNYSAIEGYTFTGEMLLVVRSKISEADYNFKYETHIRNLQDEAMEINDNFTVCENWLIKKWKEIEVENVYDTNLDGLKIQFTIEVCI